MFRTSSAYGVNIYLIWICYLSYFSELRWCGMCQQSLKNGFGHILGNNKKRTSATVSPHPVDLLFIFYAIVISFIKAHTLTASQCCCEGDNRQNVTQVRGKGSPWIISFLNRNKSLPRGVPLSLITKRRSPMDYFCSAVRCQAFDVGNGIPAGSSMLTS